MAKIWDRLFGQETPAFTEKSETAELHRYGYGNQVSIRGEKVESSAGVQVEEGSLPLVILRLGDNRESNLYRSSDVMFENRNIDYISLTSELPGKVGGRTLAVGVPLIGEGEKAPKFSLTIDRQKREITQLQLDPSLTLELRDPDGSRFILKERRGERFVFEVYDPKTDQWNDQEFRPGELVLSYGDTVLIQQKTDDQVRQVSASLALGTEGSGIRLQQALLKPEEATSREPLPHVREAQKIRAERDQAIEAWFEAIKADRKIWSQLLKERDIRVAPQLEPLPSPEAVEELFTVALSEAKHRFVNEPDLAVRTSERLLLTIQEVDWAGTPAAYTHDRVTEQPRGYFLSFLDSHPDAALFSWALDAMVKQFENDQQSFSWDMAPWMFPTPESYRTWKQVFTKHASKVKELASSLGLEKLSGTELQWFALSLRLGIKGKNPYL